MQEHFEAVTALRSDLLHARSIGHAKIGDVIIAKADAINSIFIPAPRSFIALMNAILAMKREGHASLFEWRYFA